MEEERRTTTDRRNPEERVVGTLQALAKIGLNPASVVLIAVCVAIVWWALIYQPANDKTRQYSIQMIELVTNIQLELQSKNKMDAEFRREMVRTLDNHTREITTLYTLLATLGFWPLDQDDRGNLVIQPPLVRKQLFNDETNERN